MNTRHWLAAAGLAGGLLCNAAQAADKELVVGVSDALTGALLAFMPVCSSRGCSLLKQVSTLAAARTPTTARAPDASSASTRSIAQATASVDSCTGSCAWPPRRSMR